MTKRTILYITAFTPFGTGETFIIEELCAIKEFHKEILIIPRNPTKQIYHQKAKDLKADTVWLPLFNRAIILQLFVCFFSLRFWRTLQSIFKESRSLGVFYKNLTVLPKSLYIARLLQKRNVFHIHAHWAGTTATMAYVIHRLTGIPYSFTTHRWDIEENNMLKEKVRTADFCRCISQRGKQTVVSIVGDQWQDRIHVLHMGVECPKGVRTVAKGNVPFILITPANLLAVKGHRFMIEACHLLKAQGRNFNYWIVGDGVFEDKLKQLVKDHDVEDVVSFLGRLPHEKVIEMYRDRAVDLVVMPSINDDDGQHEGIPVALMEAMSYGIPVISTETGGIPELIGDGSGIMVKEKDGSALASAVERLMTDVQWYGCIGAKGRKKIENDFNLSKLAKTLMLMFEKQESNCKKVP